MDRRASKIAGGLWGMLVGDALGVPYEFHRREQIPPHEAIEMTPPPGFRRAHEGVAPGTWSDDGALGLALLRSLLDRRVFDIDDFANKLMAWYQHGDFAVGANVFDVGVQTAASIRALMRGIAPEDAGGRDQMSNGNGSLMRVLPLALWHPGPDEELVRDAHRQSRVTHAHPRSEACCAFYCLWARYLLHERPDPWGEAAATLRLLYEGNEERLGELETHVRPEDDAPGNGSGYVVDTLRSARWALAQGPYETVVKQAIALGDDTDTTACVAGGIAGIRDGIEAIPRRWLDAMMGRDIADPLLNELVRLRAV